MLIVDSSAENNQRTGTTFLSIGARDAARRKASNANSSSRDPQFVTDLEKADGRASNPFTIHHIGRHGQQYQLFADSANIRKMWKEKILEAQTKLQLNKSNSQVFELFTLNDVTFGTEVRTTGGTAGNSKVKITCSVAFGMIFFFNLHPLNLYVEFVRRICASNSCVAFNLWYLLKFTTGDCHH
jgi:hypothetical protein